MYNYPTTQVPHTILTGQCPVPLNNLYFKFESSYNCQLKTNDKIKSDMQNVYLNLYINSHNVLPVFINQTFIKPATTNQQQQKKTHVQNIKSSKQEKKFN